MTYYRTRKSQIAIEYCYRFKDLHPDWNIFWVHAATKERFEQAFKAIARNCKLPGWDDPAKNSLDLVYDWLSVETSWLMIIDNADDKDVFFDQRPTHVSQNQTESQRSTLPLVLYLPQRSGKGLMLITSRNRNAAFRLTNSVEHLIDVPYMGKEEAVALLCKKLPGDLSTDAERSELVELLEYLPLAITQAASYIGVKRTRMTVARYSTLLRKNGNILLDDMGDLRRDATIPSSVLLTWHISFDKINGENRPAAELLSLMSVFDRQGIPQYLLQKKDEDDLDFENRLAPLEEFALITAEESGQGFQMHRLIQMAIRSWLERHGEIDHWEQNAANLLVESVPGYDYQSWKTWETLLPHSEVVLNYVFPNQEGQLLHAQILHCTALYLEERGSCDAAREKCQRALDMRLRLLGEDDVSVALSLLSLANLKRLSSYDHRVESEEAEDMTRRAVDIFERVQGTESTYLMSARNSLALILLGSDHERKIKEATEIFRSILASQEQSLGSEHPWTLTSMNNLALAFRDQHKYDEAEKLHRRTLETRVRLLGEDDPDTMICMQNLANYLYSQKRYEEAQELAQRTLELSTTVLGEEHPKVLNRMNLLACIFREQDKYEEAEELFRSLLDLRTKVLGSDHASTIQEMAFLAEVLHRQGKHRQAEEFYKKFYNKPTERWCDRDDWDNILEHFADTLAKLGKHDEASQISRQRVLSEDASSSLLEDASSDVSEMSTREDHLRPASEDASSDVSEMSTTEDHLRPRSPPHPELPLETPEMRRRMIT